jgi:diguanylate cyclase (GGDEF)-like protein
MASNVLPAPRGFPRALCLPRSTPISFGWFLKAFLSGFSPWTAMEKYFFGTSAWSASLGSSARKPSATSAATPYLSTPMRKVILFRTQPYHLSPRFAMDVHSPPALLFAANRAPSCRCNFAPFRCARKPASSLAPWKSSEPLGPVATGERRNNKLAAFGCLDPLTGVLNRSMIQAHLHENLILHSVYPVPLCVMTFTVDNLAKLNERFGQASVDTALRVASQTLENSLRPTDFIGHWIEHEFLAILTECNESDAIRAAERLRKMVERAHVTFWGDTLNITISIGVTIAHDQDTVGSIVSRSEQALHKSQTAGGNQVALVSH